MWPLPLRSRAGRSVLVTRITPITLVSYIWRQFSSSASATGSSPSAPPALLTTTDTSGSCSVSSATESGSATSSRSARPPTSRATASQRSRRLAAATTSNPAAASERTVASPMPLLAPVTSAILPVSLIDETLSRHGRGPFSLIGSIEDQGGPEGTERGQALHEGRRTGQRWLIASALSGCLLLALLPIAPALAKHHKAVSVHFKGAQSDQAVLTAGALPVKVRSSRTRKVQLSVTAFQGGPSLTKPLGVKLRRGRRSLSLPLSTAGTDVLQGCAAGHLTVTAGARKKKRKVLGSSSAPVSQSVPQCDVLNRAARCETIASPGTNCL